MEGIQSRPPMITAAHGWLTGRLKLPPNGAMLLLASIIVSFLAASSAPTPLYALYQTRWGFSAITTTVIFGVYALAVLSALLTLGRTSDHIGRRPVLLGAIAVQAMAMFLFATADSIAALLFARIVQGLSTGAAVAAVGAAMLDIDRTRGAVANSVAPGVGTALGAMASALVVHYLPAPTHLIYLVLLGLFALQAIGVLAIPETAKPQPGILASLIPEVRLPRRVARSFAVAAPVLFAVWALAGFYGSLGPALIATLVHSRSSVFAGVGLFILAGAAAASVVLLRNTPSRRIMLVGVVALIVGVSITLVSTSLVSPAGLFTGTAIAGAGFGSGFQGGIRLVLPLAQAHERAGVLSLLYVVSYLGMGLPAVMGGLLVVESGDLLITAREYGVAVIVLAAVALAGLMLPESQPMRECGLKASPAREGACLVG
jgi:predicted MFS family arabinose efflux permease